MVVHIASRKTQAHQALFNPAAIATLCPGFEDACMTGRFVVCCAGASQCVALCLAAWANRHLPSDRQGGTVGWNK